MKYVAKNSKGHDISSVSLAGREYKADDGVIEVPDDHHAARDAAALVGLEHAPVEETHPKKTVKT